MKELWGIDLGGTKIEGAVLSINSKAPHVLSRIRIPTEQDKGYQHIINQIKLLVARLSKETGLKPNRLGIGTPGTLDPYSKTMKNCNSTCLNDKPLKKDLEDELQLPIEMANDANCFALSETHFGTAQTLPKADVVFGVIMGTGVGGGIIVDGKAINGLQGIAGEWGHNFLDDSGGMCYCGRTGCVETVISGPALEKYYTTMSGKKLSLKQITTNYYDQQSDEAAQATIERLCKFFGKAIAVIINILDPDLIILGGGVGNIEALYSEGAKEIRKYVFNNRLETPILKPELGDSAGVFGAAMLVA